MPFQKGQKAWNKDIKCNNISEGLKKFHTLDISLNKKKQQSDLMKGEKPITKPQKFNIIRDKLKKDYLEKKGWIIKVIWENDMKKGCIL